MMIKKPKCKLCSCEAKYEYHTKDAKGRNVYFCSASHLKAYQDANKINPGVK